MFIAAFDFVETGSYLDNWLSLQTTEAESSNFEAVGYESIYLLHNLGTLVFAFAGFFLIASVTWLLNQCCGCCATGETARKSGGGHGDGLAWRKLYYGSLINLVVESYSILAVACFINLKHMSWGSAGEII